MCIRVLLVALADDFISVLKILRMLAFALALVRDGGWAKEVLWKGSGHIHLGLYFRGLFLHLAHIRARWQDPEFFAERNVLLCDCVILCVLGLSAKSCFALPLGLLLRVKVKIESLLDLVGGGR